MNMSFRRRQEEKTDYAQRLVLLRSGKPRLVIRKSLNNFHVQLIKSDDSDRTITETFSKALQKYGWKGHGGNMSAAYLTGYVAGLNAQKHNIREAVVDLGLQTSVRGSGLYAAALGVKDSGVSVNIGKEAVPHADRIAGRHVADYAAKLKGQDKYKKQFANYLKKGLAPEELPRHFEEVKSKIDAEFAAARKTVKQAAG